LTRLSSMDHRLPAFVSTLHDPHGSYLAALEERAGALGWYSAVYVCATASTDERVVSALRALGTVVEIRPERKPGVARRLTVELANRDGRTSMHYCDFDRWLHWVGRFPDELRSLQKTVAEMEPRPWYVCFGRTPRAYATHPEVQQLAERATSRAFELVIGREIDATAGSCWLSAEGAEIIVQHSIEPTMGTDLEWPSLVWRHDPRRVAMVHTEGLEFESTEFSQSAAEIGEAAWIEETYQRPEMWQMRFQLAADSIAALNRVLSMPLMPDSHHSNPATAEQ
jgi:hypothetical protein